MSRRPPLRYAASLLLLSLLATAGCGKEAIDLSAPPPAGVSAVGAHGETLRAAFEAGHGRPRVIALLSPT